jgi:hypothetical protein
LAGNAAGREPGEHDARCRTEAPFSSRGAVSGPSSWRTSRSLSQSSPWTFKKRRVSSIAASSVAHGRYIFTITCRGTV